MKLFKRILPVAAVLAAVFVVYANLKVIGFEELSFGNVAELPVEKACLVLGTSKYLSSGRENLFYTFRIAAAKQVYAAGKCSVIVVSGDNRRKDYNEPEAMKQSLVKQGVPADRIYCDYAGGRTLDSVIRFKHIFGQTSGIVISQQFHNARAIYIGEGHGIELTGFNAREVGAYGGLRTKVREVLSRVRAVADVEILESEPRHYGEAVRL